MVEDGVQLWPQEKSFEGSMGSWLVKKKQHEVLGKGEGWVHLPMDFSFFFGIFCVKLVAIP